MGAAPFFVANAGPSGYAMLYVVWQFVAGKCVLTVRRRLVD
jgi:hypothetical protein